MTDAVAFHWEPVDACGYVRRDDGRWIKDKGGCWRGDDGVWYDALDSDDPDTASFDAAHPRPAA